ncbi:MAG: class I SAM-dependent methyltransferase [Bacteroidota bacterium]|nr:class I SAM-dependent methyltransferase [Bacteroidota bacterium]
MNTISNTGKERKAYWEKIYQTKQSTEVSWYEAEPKVSIDIISQFNLPKSAHIMDCGAGDSRLVDYHLKLGYENITVLDISEAAFERTKKRLGEEAKKINWVVADEAKCKPDEQYDLWHDRAAFHFLTDEHEISNYLITIKNCIKPGGYLILATFSEQGPKKCSGLNIKQYSESSMTELLKDSFEKLKCFTVDHQTPFNTIQNFLYCSFKRKQNTANGQNSQ